MSLTIELPPNQTALIGVGDGSLTLTTEFDVPKLQDDMVIVRNRAIGINPVDTKMKGDLAAPGAIGGIDFCGEVLAIGRNFASPAQVKVGDRVCAAPWVWPCSPRSRSPGLPRLLLRSPLMSLFMEEVRRLEHWRCKS